MNENWHWTEKVKFASIVSLLFIVAYWRGILVSIACFLIGFLIGKVI